MTDRARVVVVAVALFAAAGVGVVAGAAGVVMRAPVLACGDTPGFCPNPPRGDDRPHRPGPPVLTCPECGRI